LVRVRVVEKVDYERRDAHGAIEAIARAPIPIALNHGARYFEQAVRAVPIQRLLYHASWTPYLQAVFAVEEMFERVKRVVGAWVPRIQGLFFVVKGSEDVRRAFRRGRGVVVEAVAGVVRVRKSLRHGEVVGSRITFEAEWVLLPQPVVRVGKEVVLVMDF